MQRDEEHNRYLLHIEDRSSGYPRQHTIGVDFVTAGEYRTLLANHRDIPALDGDIVVSTAGAIVGRDRGADAAADETAIGGGPVDEATKLAAEPKDRVRKPSKDAQPTSPLHSLDELVDYFIAAGKKGVAINRYKGLGEMNPDQLWETTMDPDSADAAAGARRRSHRSRPDVHDADGRSGRAAPQVHRRQRAGRQEPGRVEASGLGAGLGAYGQRLAP